VEHAVERRVAEGEVRVREEEAKRATVCRGGARGMREHAAAEVEAPGVDVEPRRQVASTSGRFAPSRRRSEDTERLAVVARPQLREREPPHVAVARGALARELEERHEPVGGGSWSGARWS
jgi:hypothetical protein